MYCKYNFIDNEIRKIKYLSSLFEDGEELEFIFKGFLVVVVVKIKLGVTLNPKLK